MNGVRILALLTVLLAGCGDTPPDDPLGPPAPLGSVTVRWSFENEVGEPVNCENTTFTSTRIRVGGAPVEVTCGSDESVRFSDLLPGRYGVVIELLAVGAVVQDVVGNIEVNGDDVTFEHVFSVAGGSFGNGNMEIRWFIDGESAARGCILVGGSEVRIQIVDGPEDIPSFTRPCTDTRTVLEDVRQGSYRIVLSLRDSEGERIGFSSIADRVFVTQNMTEVVSMDVVTALPDGGDLTALWTVNSSAAAEGCAAAPGSFVEIAIRTDISQSVDIATGTAACDMGGIALTELPVGRTPSGAGLRATLSLIERTLGTRILDSQIVRDIVVQPSATSTINVDFRVTTP